jgi:hypothetical protein
VVGGTTGITISLYKRLISAGARVSFFDPIGTDNPHIFIFDERPTGITKGAN